MVPADTQGVADCGDRHPLPGPRTNHQWSWLLQLTLQVGGEARLWRTPPRWTCASPLWLKPAATRARTAPGRCVALSWHLTLPVACSAGAVPGSRMGTQAQSGGALVQDPGSWSLCFQGLILTLGAAVPMTGGSHTCPGDGEVALCPVGNGCTCQGLHACGTHTSMGNCPLQRPPPQPPWRAWGGTEQTPA